MVINLESMKLLVLSHPVTLYLLICSNLKLYFISKYDNYFLLCYNREACWGNSSFEKMWPFFTMLVSSEQVFEIKDIFTNLYDPTFKTK